MTHTVEQEREAIVSFLLNRAARFKELAEQARQNGALAEYAGLTSVAVACEHNARDVQRGDHIQAQHKGGENG